MRLFEMTRSVNIFSWMGITNSHRFFLRNSSGYYITFSIYGIVCCVKKRCVGKNEHNAKELSFLSVQLDFFQFYALSMLWRDEAYLIQPYRFIGR